MKLSEELIQHYENQFFTKPLVKIYWAFFNDHKQGYLDSCTGIRYALAELISITRDHSATYPTGLAMKLAELLIEKLKN